MFILLSVCLLGSPTTCREERIDLSFESSSPMACMINAQPMIAQWHETHAQWNVKAWRCTPRGSLPKDI